MCHPSAIFVSEQSYEPFFGGVGRQDNPILICIYNSIFIFLLINGWGVGWDKLSIQKELFSHFTPLSLHNLLPWLRGIPLMRKNTQLLLPLSLKEGNWHNSKISSRILLRTLVFTGRNYHLLFKRISEKINSDLIWQGNYFSGLITLQEI